MKLNKIFPMALAAFALTAFTACMDDVDEPNTDGYLITSKTDIGEVNYSIAQLKNEHSSLFGQTNAFEQVKEDLIIEGVVAANDCGGNLYQTVLIRYIDETKPEGDADREFELWASLKFIGPDFGLKTEDGRNRMVCDRFFLVDRNGKKYKGE